MKSKLNLSWYRGSISDWSEQTGIPYQTLLYRLKRFPLLEALGIVPNKKLKKPNDPKQKEPHENE